MISAVDLLREWKGRNSQIRNVVLFVSDSLRWDYTPKSILSQGVTFKAVASGSMTAISFPSIVTGFYPPRLGVYTFHRNGLRSSIPSLLNLHGYNTSIWTQNSWVGYDPPTSSPLYKILGCKNRVPLEEITPPFVYLEDEKGGHCPYGWTSESTDYEEWDCASFYRDFGKRGVEAMREKYREGIARSAREFEERMKVIRERGIEDTTLVIFLSDHGELLGERGGIVGHGSCMAPEITYVPVVFIHPDLPKDTIYERDGLLRHVDICPTIKDILAQTDQTTFDGTSLLRADAIPQVGFSYFLEGPTRRGPLHFLFREIGVWDKDGGYVFRREMGPVKRILRALYTILLRRDSTIAMYQRRRLRNSPLHLKNCMEAVRWWSSASEKFGTPSFDQGGALSLLREFESKAKDAIGKQTFNEEEDELVKARLRALGYLD